MPSRICVGDEIPANIPLAIDVRLLHSTYVFNLRLRIMIACCIVLSKSILTLLPQKEYLDKTLVNYANVMGLQADAGINGMQY